MGIVQTILPGHVEKIAAKCICGAQSRLYGSSYRLLGGCYVGVARPMRIDITGGLRCDAVSHFIVKKFKLLESIYN